MPEFADHRLTVETARFGPLAFQVGVDAAAVETALLRVSDAQQRFQGSPLSQVASRLEREVVATSVFGTNSIEGGTLSEEETQEALDLDPSMVQNIEQRRVLNIKAAYVLANRAVMEPDRVNRLVHRLLFENDLKRRHDEKRINARQYAIATQILQAGGPIPLAELRRAPWYRALYLERTDKTKQRDLQGLREQGLVVWDKSNRLWAGVGSRDAGQDQ